MCSVYERAYVEFFKAHAKDFIYGSLGMYFKSKVLR